MLTGNTPQLVFATVAHVKDRRRSVRNYQCYLASRSAREGFAARILAERSYVGDNDNDMEARKVPAKLQKLLANARVKQVPQGQIVLYEGDRPNEAYVLKEGIIKLHTIDEAGNDKILHLLKEGNALPLAFFSGEDTPCRWYYTALTDCVLYVFPRQELETLLFGDPETGKYFTNTFSNEVHELLTRLDSISKTDVNMKLTAALRYLAACHGIPGKGAWYRIPFAVSHQLLADMIGMSRESTSICMKDLSTKKIVRNPRITQLEIHLDRLITYRAKLNKGL
jgi:CRP-like cAMP-binding protein